MGRAEGSCPMGGALLRRRRAGGTGDRASWDSHGGNLTVLDWSSHRFDVADR